MDSALPPRDACSRRGRRGGLWLLIAALAVVAGVVGWLVCGGR